MFKRPHRQIVATIVLVAGTVLPTGLVLVYALRTHGPSHRAEVERVIGQSLGMSVSIQAVRHPRPDEDELVGVQVWREGEGTDTGALPIAVVHRLRIRRAPGEVTLDASGMTLNLPDARDAIEIVERLLGRMDRQNGPRISVLAPECELVWAASERQRLGGMAAQFRSSGIGTGLSASFQISGGMGPDPSSTRCELTLRRELGSPNATTLIRFRTMDGSLPIRSSASLGDVAGWLGESAKWNGEVVLSGGSSTDWELRFQGALHEVELGNLGGLREKGQEVHVRGLLEVDEARWGDLPDGQGPGWLVARGRYLGGPGSIGMGFLRSLAEEVGFRPSPASLQAGGELVEFDELGLRFSLDEGGRIELAGGLGPSMPPDTVIARGNSTIAAAPQSAFSVRSLARALVPTADEELVPAVAESRLLRHLPLPRSVKAQGSAIIRANSPATP